MGEKLTRTQQKNLERLGGVNPADDPIPRRQFLAQVGVGAAALGAAGGAGVYIADPWGMKGVEPPPPVRLKDYSVGVPIGRPSLVVARSTPPSADAFEDADALYDAREAQALTMVRAALGEMGGVEHFIQKGDVVVIKPNVAFDKNPDLAATTQPDTVSAVVKLCLGAGARKVIVCDNPINNPESCFFKTRVGDAAQRAGATLMLPKSSYFEQLEIGGETITHTWSMFYAPFKYANKVIGISPVKDHNLCKATVSLKNWYGLLGNPRNQFHQDIHGIISDFAKMMKPTFVIADGRKLLMRNGPTGGSLNDVKQADALVVGTDHVAVDSWCVTELLERNWDDVLYLDRTIRRGLADPAIKDALKRSWSAPWVREISVA